MAAVRLRKIEKIFETNGYRLVIYYHNDLSVKDIYNIVIKKDEHLKGKGFEPETQDNGVAYTLTNNSGTSLLIINGNTKLHHIHHECIHIAMEMFEYMGAHHTDDTDEIFAYSSQHVFEFVTRLMLDKFGISAKALVDF